MHQQAVSATMIKNSAQEIFPHKQKGLTLKQLGSFYAGYLENFESKLVYIPTNYLPDSWDCSDTCYTKKKLIF
jgi:hypothetical protein